MRIKNKEFVCEILEVKPKDRTVQGTICSAELLLLYGAEKFFAFDPNVGGNFFKSFGVPESLLKTLVGKKFKANFQLLSVEDVKKTSKREKFFSFNKIVGVILKRFKPGLSEKLHDYKEPGNMDWLDVVHIVESCSTTNFTGGIDFGYIDNLLTLNSIEKLKALKEGDWI